jgi:hypothetical protein
LLTVSKLSTCSIEESFTVSDGLKISFLEDAEGNNYYEIVDDSCSSCFPQEFDPSLDHTIEFNQNRMIGVTVIRIEDGGLRTTEYEYDFDSCPVYLSHNGSVLTARTTATLDGNSAHTDCVTITEQVLVNP